MQLPIYNFSTELELGTTETGLDGLLTFANNFPANQNDWIADIPTVAAAASSSSVVTPPDSWSMAGKKMWISQ